MLDREISLLVRLCKEGINKKSKWESIIPYRESYICTYVILKNVIYNVQMLNVMVL